MPADADVQAAARENAVTRWRLKRLFWWALAARLVVAFAIHFGVGNDDAFAPDQRTYDWGGQILAGNWTGEIPAPLDTLLPSGRKGYFYVVGVLYFLFGTNPLIPKLVNCLVGAFIVPTVFDLSIRMGGSARAALKAATFATWFPSLVLWSALNIRDAWIILLIVLICRESLILQDRPKPTSFFVLAAAVLTIVQFRDYILFAVTGPMVVSFFARNSRNMGRKRSALVGVEMSACSNWLEAPTVFQ